MMTPIVRFNLALWYLASIVACWAVLSGRVGPMS